MRALLELHRDLSVGGRASLERTASVTVAMAALGIFSSVLALTTGWTGFSLGLFSGVFLPLLGVITIANRSALGVSIFAAFAALASVVFLLSFISVMVLSKGDVIGCLCSQSCSDRLSLMGPLLLDGWSCRHVPLARTLSWLAISLGLVNALLQSTVSYSAFSLAETLARETELWVADSETQSFRPTDALLPFPPSSERPERGVTTALPRPAKVVETSKSGRTAG
jgi:hypothetical protein